MRVTVLGQYSPYPAPGGACSGYLLEEGDTRVLLDCGPGALGRLLQAVGPERLTAVVLSHLHYDHMSDLLAMGYALEFSGRGKLPLYMPEGPEPVRALLERGPYVPRPMADGAIGSIHFAYLPARHPVPGFSVKARGGGRTLLYTGDTNWHEGLVPFARGCSLVLADAALTRAMWKEQAPHMSAAHCARLALEAGAEALILTHLRPDVDQARLLAEARALCPFAVLAQAGMTLSC